MGGLFTVITAPIWIFCPENEFFKNQSPFRKKVWQEQEEIEEIVNSKFTKFDKKFDKKIDKRIEEFEKEIETAFNGFLKTSIRVVARVSGIERFIQELTYVDIERSRAVDRLVELQAEEKRFLKERIKEEKMKEETKKTKESA
jgi:hypothetical protein